MYNRIMSETDDYKIIKKCMILSKENEEYHANVAGMSKGYFIVSISKKKLSEKVISDLLLDFLRQGIYNGDFYLIKDYQNRTEFLKKIRKFCGYTQQNMAEEMDIPKHAYRQKELTGVLDTNDREKLLTIAATNNLKIAGDEIMLLDK